ncbi:MAG: PQQ-dependent sugar dehydrogenase [Bacteroidota bacterium]
MNAYRLLFTILGLVLGLSNLDAQVTFENAFPNLNFSFPVEIQNSGVPGDDRLFVVEQEGIIRVFENDPTVTSSTVFLDIQSQVLFEVTSEIGLLGLAFHPDYATNGYFYVFYTTLHTSGNIQINVSRFSRSSSDINQADPLSECVILTEVKNQINDNHNGGRITFGPDGYLYISIGDGGGQGDPEKNGQNTSNLFGSIARIDINTNCPTVPYAIPADNPLVGSSGRDEIFAWGVRNTWKMSFDPNTNRLWGGDVGQDDRCEINLLENGGNYGWNRFEGTTVEDITTPDPGNTVFPVYEYDYEADDRSVTAGYVYRGSAITSTNPSIFGQLIFGDFVSGRVWALAYDPSTGTASRTELFDYNGFISSFGEDIDGEIYFANYFNGDLLKLVDGQTPPSATPVNGVGTWCTSSSGTNGTILALAEDAAGNIYAGGDFTTAGNVTANHIARWNGTNWNSLGTGSNGRINALAFDSNGHLYAGGAFTQIGGVSANNIAQWNGSNWSALGSGTNGPVAVLAIDSNDQLYVAGAFETVNGSTSANNVAIWNGNTWSALSDGNTGLNGTNNEIRGMAIDENDVLYVGGNFGLAGGVTVDNIAQWNGTNWSGLGSGTTGFVQVITAATNYIYAGGIFPQAGGVDVNRIARYNRNTQVWEPINNGLNGSVYAIELNSGQLYAGGAFLSASNSNNNNILVNGIARQSTGNWEALGVLTDVGVENAVRALLFSNNTLYVGGTFSYAGPASNIVNNFTCWQEIFLPVELIHFTAEERVSGNFLQWEVANEIAIDRYLISRSTNGFQFQELQEVKANNAGLYDYLDANITQQGTYYYQLEMFDVDGSISGREVVSVVIDQERSIIITPNPASDFIRIETNGQTVERPFYIVNSAGMHLLSGILQAEEQQTINTAQWSNGTYFLAVLQDDQSYEYIQFVVSR